MYSKRINIALLEIILTFLFRNISLDYSSKVNTLYSLKILFPKKFVDVKDVFNIIWMGNRFKLTESRAYNLYIY